MKKQTLKARYVPQDEYDALKAAHDELNAQFLDLTKRTWTARELAAKLIADAVTGRADPPRAFTELQQIYVALY